MKVLIVEDEINLAESLSQIMTEQKYLTDVVYDGQDGLDYARIGDYDVIVLDVMLPRLNGFEVVKQLRIEKNDVPIILLTAKDEIASKVTGLDCGADDYMTKPFSPAELLARIRAASRRQGEVIAETLSFDDLTLNLSEGVLSNGARSIHLGYKELELLKMLMAKPAIILSKEEIISKIWGNDSNAEDNNVEAYISFLRKKFAFLNSRVNVFTKRKIGYKLEIKE